MLRSDAHQCNTRNEENPITPDYRIYVSQKINHTPIKSYKLPNRVKNLPFRLKKATSIYLIKKKNFAISVPRLKSSGVQKYKGARIVKMSVLVIYQRALYLICRLVSLLSLPYYINYALSRLYFWCHIFYKEKCLCLLTI